MVDGNLGFGGAIFDNSAIFLSAWYLNGGNTPSNQNTGFIQHYDVDGGSVSSMNTFWDGSLTTFTFSVLGGNGDPGCTYAPDGSGTDDCGRLWNAGSALGASSTTAGIFVDYRLSFVATGLTTAVWNATTGVYESNSNPTGVTGSIWAIFQNTSTTSLASNGWYVANLGLDLNSLYGENSDSYFGSDDVVPEPATMTLLATGLAGLAAARKRKKQR